MAVAAVSIIATAAAVTAPAFAASHVVNQPGVIHINDQVIRRTNSRPIAIPTDVAGPDGVVLAGLYPSTIDVAGHPGKVTSVEVTLNNLTHPFVGDLDVMLVGPQGQQVMLMSDVNTVDPENVTNATFTLNDASGPMGRTLQPVDDEGVPVDAFFQPTDLPNGGPDVFPAPAPVASDSRGSLLSAFNDASANGSWSLYVLDQFGTKSPGFAGGWSLDIGTDSPTPLEANPYGSSVDVTALPKGVTDVDVTVSGFQHTNPVDVDMMLVGPTGQSVMLMSDVGGLTPVAGVNLTLDDEAAREMPEASALSTGSFKPANYLGDGPDEFPSPAPDPLNAAKRLTAFDGTDPNGTWRLFVVDQFGRADGEIAGGWSLKVATVDRPDAPTFTAPASGSTVDDGIVALRGTGQPASTVRIMEGTTEVASTSANSVGVFDVAMVAVANGLHVYTAQATDRFGNTSLPSVALSVRVAPGTAAGPTPTAPPTTPGTPTAPSTRVDTVAPVGTISINAGADRTRRTSAILSLTANDPAPGSGVAKMRFSNDGKSYSPFQTFAASKVWTLSGVNGTKTVWVQFVDKAGTISTAAADSIVLDTVAPTVLRSTPVTNATGVGRSSNITVTLSESVVPKSITKVSVWLVTARSGDAVRAVITYNARTHRVTVNPLRRLAPHAIYRLRVGTGVRDLAGNQLDQSKRSGLQAKTWSFTTR